MGVENNQTSGSLNATLDWWGSSTGPTSSGNPGGTGSAVVGNVSFSPWLGDANIVTPDYLVFPITTGNQYVVTPNSGNTSLSVTLGGNSIGPIPGGGTLGFTGSGGTVTINGETGAGSTDVFTIKDTSVQFSAADGLERQHDQFPRHRHHPQRGCQGSDQHLQYPGRRRQRALGKPGGRFRHQCVRLQRDREAHRQHPGRRVEHALLRGLFQRRDRQPRERTNGTATGVVSPAPSRASRP